MQVRIDAYRFFLEITKVSSNPLLLNITLLCCHEVSLMRTASAKMTSWCDVCTSSDLSPVTAGYRILVRLHFAEEEIRSWQSAQTLIDLTNILRRRLTHSPEYGTYSTAVLLIRNETLPSHVIVSTEVCQWSSSHDYPLHWPVLTPGAGSHMSPVMMYAGVRSSGPGT